MDALAISLLAILTGAVISLNFKVGYLEAELKLIKSMLESLLGGDCEHGKGKG